jgi:hypothetical protein
VAGQRSTGDLHGSLATLATAARSVPRYVQATGPLRALWAGVLQAAMEADRGFVCVAAEDDDDDVCVLMR